VGRRNEYRGGLGRLWEETAPLKLRPYGTIMGPESVYKYKTYNEYEIMNE